MGFIFAYKSDAQQFETFKKWFIPTSANEILNIPSAVGCLDQGLILLAKENYWLVSPKSGAGMQIKGWMLPLLDGQGKPIELTEAERVIQLTNMFTL